MNYQLLLNCNKVHMARKAIQEVTQEAQQQYGVCKGQEPQAKCPARADVRVD
jgi:hypothetical protein